MRSLMLCLASLTAGVLTGTPAPATCTAGSEPVANAAQRVREVRNSTPAEESVMELERQWAKAEEKFDPKALDEILARNFVSMDECGTIRNKAHEIASDREWNPPGPEVIDDMSVHVYGDTAVVLGRFTWTDRDTGRVKLQGRFVDTFLRRAGQWKV